MPPLTPEDVKSLFCHDAVVDHYAAAAVDIGLWRSEEVFFQQALAVSDTILELGCGSGRIALGLWELGYRQIMGTDFSREMIKSARRLAGKLEYAVPFRVADATALKFEDAMFDGVIFGFNGLMQIPSRERRRGALREMLRVVRPGGTLVFTTHDRAVGAKPEFWTEEKERWAAGHQDPRLVEFGDLFVDGPHGDIYIHIPTRDEIVADLAAVGAEIVTDVMRSEIAQEPADVVEFSVECRFWQVRRPAEA
ncbi:class I SAM-dependent methyltransferase [Synoicihabitans lomoniglobus]|uniref:Class I SAM-dependent methyltransferase n=1 Tax=Synoicihabitans lomoniglobus TaxID=2909285 RepID=A0AAF0CS46_9BACT|nr:class I SAM-dependent methyltransferase [Opitutaceae bacterium LMO-M01]WED67023.1 class I SAM-dependent methyltransferase [Opitutaceae bacterium LMO-M01]